MAEKKTADVVQLLPKKDKKNTEAKWGRAVMDHGFTIIPSLLLQAQQRLGLKAQHLAVLLQLADHWWEPERNPYPGKKRLAERLSMSERQVQRIIQVLEEVGLVKRIPRSAAHRGKLSNEYDLSGLVKKLQRLEPEFREVREMRKQVARKGGLGLRGKKEHQSAK